MQACIHAVDAFAKDVECLRNAISVDSSREDRGRNGDQAEEANRLVRGDFTFFDIGDRYHGIERFASFRLKLRYRTDAVQQLNRELKGFASGEDGLEPG